MKSLILCVLIAGCVAGRLPVAAQEKAADLLKNATFCPALEENQAPKGKAESFQPTDVVFLSLELKGRPKSGVVKASFLFRDEVVAESSVDVATVNKGVIASAGQNTFVGFSLKPKGALPVADGALWRVHVQFNETDLGVFRFKIAPPKDAIESKLLTAVLAKGITEGREPVQPSESFGRGEMAYLAGKLDLGKGTWVEINWLANGKVQPDGTRSFTGMANNKATPYFFSFLPKTGWPDGEVEAVVLLNGAEVARKKFKVDPAIPVNEEPRVATVTLSTKKEKVVTEVQAGETVVYVAFDLEKPTLSAGCRIMWYGLNGAKETLIAAVEMPEDAISPLLTSSLTVEKGLPAGNYRVDLRKGEKVIAKKKFAVKE